MELGSRSLIGKDEDDETETPAVDLIDPSIKRDEISYAAQISSHFFKKLSIPASWYPDI